MSYLWIANWQDADRRSATAGEAMDPGMVVKVSADADGGRFLMKMGDGDDAQVTAKKYAVVFKVSAKADTVETTTVPAALGSRLLTIVSGDAVIEVRKGAIIEYSADLLDDSLNPDEGGSLPSAGDALEIKGSKWAEVGSGEIESVDGVAGMCYRSFPATNRVLVELV